MSMRVVHRTRSLYLVPPPSYEVRILKLHLGCPLTTTSSRTWSISFVVFSASPHRTLSKLPRIRQPSPWMRATIPHCERVCVPSRYPKCLARPRSPQPILSTCGAAISFTPAKIFTPTTTPGPTLTQSSLHDLRHH